MSALASRVFELAVLTVSLAACTIGRVIPLEQDPNLITAAELADSRAASAYEAIARLRPQFLRIRGPSSVLNPATMGPTVIADHTVLGGTQVLADIPIKDIEAIRYVAAWDATTRYGSGYANGVIEVRTWRGRPSSP